MCLICRDYQRGLLTQNEALRNAQEWVNVTPDDEEATHLYDVINELLEEKDNND